jgi:D-Tyr-tRNAtyr deacylase
VWTIEAAITGEIATGLLVLLGIAQEDTDQDAQWLAEKDLRAADSSRTKRAR